MSTVQIKLVSDPASISENKWEEFVKEHPYGNIFQSSYFYKACKNTNRYEPIVIFLEDDVANIVGVLVATVQHFLGNIGKFFSSRSVIFGGPLVKDNDNKLLSEILSYYNKKIKNKALYTEIRNLWDTNNERTTYEDHNYKYEEHLNYLINLKSGHNEIFKSFEQDRKWEIRKSFRKGIIIEEIYQTQKVPIFYKFIEQTYSRIKMPGPHISFIKNVFELTKKGLAKFYLARFGDTYIGAHSVLLFKKTMTCWYGGFDFNFRKYFPYAVLIWHSLKWGSENGYTIFDFQGAGKPNEEYGVREFKRRFGGQLVSFGRYNNIHHNLRMSIAKRGFALGRKIKLGLRKKK